MEIPKKLTFVEGFYFTDGGSIVLLAEGLDGVRHQITLGQHRFLEVYDPNVLPGRLYFDQLLVPVRSELEAQVLDLLRESEIIPAKPPGHENDEAPAGDGPVVLVGDDLQEYYAKIAQGKDETIRHLVKNMINYLGSDEYERIAQLIEKKVKENNEPEISGNKFIRKLNDMLGWD